MDWYRIFQGILSTAVLIYIIYRWLKVFQIKQRINNQIVEHFKNKGKEVLMVRMPYGMERVKNKLGLLSEYTRKIYTPLYSGYYRVIEIKTDENIITEELINVKILGDDIEIQIIENAK